MVGVRFESLFAEPMCDVFCLVARQAINDACVILVLSVEKLEELLLRVVFKRDAIADIGAIESSNKFLCFLQFKIRAESFSDTC